MRRSKVSAPQLLAFAVAVTATSNAFAATDPKGIWLDDKGRGAVEITECGKGLCGTVVWVKDAADKHGCGKQILGDVKPTGGGTWDYGWIYDPARGRKFDVELTPLRNGNLKVTGYAGIKFLSQSFTWTPAPADLERCDKTDTSADNGKAKAEPVAEAKPAPKAEVSEDESDSKAESKKADAKPSRRATEDDDVVVPPPRKRTAESSAKADDEEKPVARAKPAEEPAPKATAKADEPAPKTAKADEPADSSAKASKGAEDPAPADSGSQGRGNGNIKIGDIVFK